MPQRVSVAPNAAQIKPVAAAEASPPPAVEQRSQSLETPQAEQAVLAQAQSMWRSGMQVAAVELLNQAVATAEREQPGWSALMQSDRLASLVRELARMQLSLGQASLTMDLLVRLAPALSGYPDIWAIRGNVAQRLGQHQASVDAYAMALKVRPAEPRWLLGSAVSLATLGHLKAAAEMAEKARDQGPVSPQVIAYLEQLGVTLLPR
jgi:tetratricopeptide (TPR) repeat protein